MSTSWGCLGIALNQTIEFWPMSMLQWVLYMMSYMVCMLKVYAFCDKALALDFLILYVYFKGRKGVQGAEPGPVLTWSQRVKVAYGAAKGLEFLHEKCQPSIVHRDIRSSNVLLFDDFLAKIADFSLTNQSSDTAARLHSTRVLGTFGYHAPE